MSLKKTSKKFTRQNQYERKAESIISWFNINIKSREFETRLYDKSEAFAFSIVRMPYLDSNTSTSILHAAVGFEILHLS